MLAGQLLAHATPAWVAKRAAEKAHYVLRIAPCKLEIAPGTVMPLDSVAVDFVADNPGDTLLHCHQALHMDFGFMQLMKYVG